MRGPQMAAGTTMEAPGSRGMGESIREAGSAFTRGLPEAITFSSRGERRGDLLGTGSEFGASPLPGSREECLAFCLNCFYPLIFLPPPPTAVDWSCVIIL